MASTTRTIVTALGAGAVLALSACGVSNTGGAPAESGDETSGTDTQSGSGSEVDWSACTPGEDSADTTSMEADENTALTIGAFNGWDESFAAAHLAQYLLEEDGYTVEVEAFDAGPAYTGVAQGDIDFLMDGWLPITHADYVEQYGEDLEPTGCWYDNARLTIAVNEDSPAQTIGDLADMGDEYGNTLYGIEAGAGLTRQTEESAIPVYGLDNLDFRVSSTPAMLAQLQKSTEAGENVAVTLWRPHWAYDAFPVRDLEDPEGAMGATELIYNFARPGFSEDNPKVAQLLKNLVLDDEHLSSLENVMFSDEGYGGENLDDAVSEWVSDNRDFIDDWKTGKLGG